MQIGEECDEQENTQSLRMMEVSSFPVPVKGGRIVSRMPVHIGRVSKQYRAILMHLTSRRSGCKLNAMRARATTALLLAWILAGSGICQCLGSIADKLPSQSHDCGSEPAAPTGQTDESCESGCVAADAVQSRVETQADRTFAQGIDIEPSSAITRQSSESAGSRLALTPPEPASPCPPYILHSALLL